MATLNIDGRRVKVDDSFLSLSPEQQNATVEEIAASFAPVGAKAKSGLGSLSFFGGSTLDRFDHMRVTPTNPIAQNRIGADTATAADTFGQPGWRMA